MVIRKKPENAKNVVEYEIRNKTIDFEDGELAFSVAKRQQDDDVTLYICRDYMGGLVMGAATGETYVAELFIPARQYEEEDGELVPVPFNIDECVLTLWEER